jgi:hypothetical protein
MSYAEVTCTATDKAGNTSPATDYGMVVLKAGEYRYILNGIEWHSLFYQADQRVTNLHCAVTVIIMVFC